jgi:hypothetical protein
LNELQQREGELVFAGGKLMIEAREQAVATAIESYIHTPHVLSISKVVRQLASVFPEQDREMLIKQVQRSRRKMRLQLMRYRQFP